MADFISREAAKAKKIYSVERRELVVPVAEIDWIPPADVVEVVRCGDCYAYRRDPELAKAADLDPEQYCALLRCEFPPDGFCSYGRRVDNG